MGTRSLTKFIEKATINGKEKKATLMVMYRQYDGHPESIGEELATFLAPRKMVNGYGNDPMVFNGMGCLAAQVIAEFKKGVGNVYIYPANTKDAGQDYEYEIESSFDRNTLLMRCYKIGYGRGKNKTKLLFEGEPRDYVEFLKRYEAGLVI